MAICVHAEFVYRSRQYLWLRAVSGTPEGGTPRRLVEAPAIDREYPYLSCACRPIPYLQPRLKEGDTSLSWGSAPSVSWLDVKQVLHCHRDGLLRGQG